MNDILTNETKIKSVIKEIDTMENDHEKADEKGKNSARINRLT